MIQPAIFLLLSLLSLSYSQLNFAASPADPTLNWKTSLTLTCSWDPNNIPDKAVIDMLADGESIYSPTCKFHVEGDRVTAEETDGLLKVVIDDLKAADSGAKFSCSMTRVGVSDSYTLSVLEPPTGAPASITITPDFDFADVAFEAVEGATKYKVGYQADQTSEWIEAEITEKALKLSGLTVATKYTVRVMPGNTAGYRTDVDIKTQAFETKDNRPPKPVDGLTASATAYNSPDITLKWSLDSNTGPKLIVSKISIEVIKDGEAQPDLAVEVQASVLEHVVALPGPGSYEFIVKTENAFIGDEKTAATISHVVKPTTEPPKPITEPPKPITEAPVVIGLLCSDPKAEGYNTVEGKDNKAVLEVLPGSSIDLACFLSDESTANSTNIQWNNTILANDDLLNNTGVSVAITDKSSKFSITDAGENQQGIYLCTLDTETCEFEVVITGMATGSESSSPHLLPALILIILPFLHLLN